MGGRQEGSERGREGGREGGRESVREGGGYSHRLSQVPLPQLFPESDHS